MQTTVQETKCFTWKTTCSKEKIICVPRFLGARFWECYGNYVLVKKVKNRDCWVSKQKRWHSKKKQSKLHVQRKEEENHQLTCGKEVAARQATRAKQ